MKRNMNINRRDFIGLTSLLLSSRVLAVGKAGGSRTEAVFLSAASDGDDNHWVIGFRLADGAGREVFRHELPGRAHHIAVHEGLGIYMVIARRPGKYLWAGDLATGEILARVTVPQDRHLYGHGVFSRDGRTFYTTENAYRLLNGDSGRVALWEISRDKAGLSLARKAEFASNGVGPHELLMMPDQQTLAVANGGIRTHPDRGREKLNLDTMLPSLAYLNAGSGELLEQHFMEPEYHQASIRHLDWNAAGQVVMGMQYQGEPFDRVPLIALHKQGEPLKELWAPEPQQGRMTQYVGSVRFDNSGRYFAAACPRGNTITFWDAEQGTMVESIRSRDGCGVCALGGGFLYTAGTGRISYFDLAADTITDFDGSAMGTVFWDNHLSMQAV